MPRHLELVLAGLERQSLREFEVLVCDDGSGKETAAVIQSFASRFPGRVEHIWQENRGFRKCRMLNEALRRARADVFVFLDGDCVPHRDFMRDHVEQQEEGRYLAGRRVELGPKLSEGLTAADVRAGFFDWPHPKLVLSMLQGDSEYLNRTLRVSWPPMRKLLKMDRVADLKGCNYSVSRQAMEAINGFDEAYEGYGREDTDAEVRLKNLGLKIKSLKGLALQFHVWHPRREFTPANEHLIERAVSMGRVRCEQGWVQ